MGLFVSQCPGCGADIEWFLKAPEKYECKECGRDVTAHEIEQSFKINNLLRRIAELEAALDEATDAWSTMLDRCPSVRGRKRLDEVRALIGK